MIRYLIALLVLLIAVPAFADIYRWVDERGTVNFTEDFSKIPAKYRKRVKVIPDQGIAAPEVIETSGEGKAEEKKPAVAEPAGNSPAASKQAVEKKKELYGGKDEDTWRTEFEKIRAEIKSYEDEISDRKARLANPDNLSRAEYLGLQLGMKRLDEKVASLKEKLAALEETARRAGVPSEVWK